VFGASEAGGLGGPSRPPIYDQISPAAREVVSPIAVPGARRGPPSAIRIQPSLRSSSRVLALPARAEEGGEEGEAEADVAHVGPLLARQAARAERPELRCPELTAAREVGATARDDPGRYTGERHQDHRENQQASMELECRRAECDGGGEDRRGGGVQPDLKLGIREEQPELREPTALGGAEASIAVPPAGMVGNRRTRSCSACSRALKNVLMPSPAGPAPAAQSSHRALRCARATLELSSLRLTASMAGAATAEGGVSPSRAENLAAAPPVTSYDALQPPWPGNRSSPCKFNDVHYCGNVDNPTELRPCDHGQSTPCRERAGHRLASGSERARVHREVWGA
jgi:hypothetical protein